ncbi:hypothetical protein ACIQFZ_39240 [Streptomyces sp. NPDC093064]
MASRDVVGGESRQFGQMPCGCCVIGGKPVCCLSVIFNPARHLTC